MRVLVAVLAFLFVVTSSLAALFMMFAALFPYDNLTDDELAEDDWLLVAGPVLIVLAVAAAACLIVTRPVWALVAVVAHAGLGAAALIFALDELSDASDYELIAFAIGVAAPGVAATALSFGQPGGRSAV